ARRTYSLTSSLRPPYNMAANLVARYPAVEARHLLNLPYAQYHADRGVVALDRHLARDRQQLRLLEASAGVDRDDLEGYRQLVGELEAARRAARSAAAGRIEALRPGDVLWVPRRGGRVVVLRPDRGRGRARVLALSEGRDLLRLGPGDLAPGSV